MALKLARRQSLCLKASHSTICAQRGLLEKSIEIGRVGEMNLVTDTNRKNQDAQETLERKILDEWDWTGVPESVRGDFAEDYYDIDPDLRPAWVDRLPNRPKRIC